MPTDPDTRCEECGRWPDHASWWDKVPAEDRVMVLFFGAIFGLVAFVMFLAAL